MSNKRTLCAVALAVSVALLPSCVEDIDIDTGENLPVVMDCVLRKDSVQTLRLYQMSKLYAEGYSPVEDATVELYGSFEKWDNYRKVSDFRQDTGNRVIWRASYEPEYGAEYKLVVRIPGQEELSAETRFPEDMKLVLYNKTIRIKNQKIDSVQNPTDFYVTTGNIATARIITEENYGSEIFGNYAHSYDEGFPFKAYLPDPGKRCKMWIYPHKDTMMVFPPDNFYEYPHELSELPFIPSSKPYCDLVVTDHPFVDNFNIIPGRAAELNYVNQPLNQVYYDRRFSLQSIMNYSQWVKQLCPDLPVHKGFVRIDQPEGFLNGVSQEDLRSSYQSSTSSFMIMGNYDKNLSPFREPFLIEVRFLSDEYDTFLRELHVKHMSRDDFILSVYDFNNIYSNIKGGVGIFGAENVTWAERVYYHREGYINEAEI